MGHRFGIAALAVLLAACDTQAPATPPAESVAPTGRVAFVVYEGSRPTLYTQALDGTDRQRLSLDGVEAGYAREQVYDRTLERYVDAIPFPRDARVLAMNAPVQWSADGQRLVLAVASAYDQSEAVVLGLDGRGAGASPTVANVVHPVFSPDGRRIAYVLWTNQDATFRLMTTDLATFATTERILTREVTNASLIWWAPDGRSLLFSRPGFANGEVQVDLRRLDLATGALTTVIGTLPGHLLDYDPVSGLVIHARPRATTPPGEYGYHTVLVHADGTEVAAPDGTRWAGLATGRAGFAVRVPSQQETVGGVELVSVDGRTSVPLSNLPAGVHVTVALDAVP